VNARRRVERIQDLLKQIGLEPERVRMANLSAAMAGRFVELACEMTDSITAIGPNPLKTSRVEEGDPATMDGGKV
jgi:coenzyme F420-reducing hydrogenase delta subunit